VLLFPLQTTLFDNADYHKMQSITPSTGFIYSGMGPDFRLVVKNARKNAQRYFLTYRELQPVNQVRLTSVRPPSSMTCLPACLPACLLATTH
jgi:hypothetical protein